jgi:hypothetical protein
MPQLGHRFASQDWRPRDGADLRLPPDAAGAPQRAAHSDDRQKVDEMRSKGDVEGADTWLRIIVAIGALGRRRRMCGIEAVKPPSRSTPC